MNRTLTSFLEEYVNLRVSNSFLHFNNQALVKNRGILGNFKKFSRRFTPKKDLYVKKSFISLQNPGQILVPHVMAVELERESAIEQSRFAHIVSE
jgi:hypothetical protein